MWEIVNKESSSTSSYTANNNRVCAVIIKIQLRDVSGAAPPELVTWLYFSKKLVAGAGAVTNFSFSVSPRWRLYMNINYKRRCTINSSKLTYILTSCNQGFIDLDWLLWLNRAKIARQTASVHLASRWWKITIYLKQLN